MNIAGSSNANLVAQAKMKAQQAKMKAQRLGQQANMKAQQAQKLQAQVAPQNLAPKVASNNKLNVQG